MGVIPDRWNNYNRIGGQILGTRFICFKVPLRQQVNEKCNIADDKILYPALLKSLIPNLGLIIDLTNTNKYYSPEDILSLGIDYKKIHVAGHQVPNRHNFHEFRATVRNFLQNNDNDKLIGVHCTHGLNRSGYMVCRYMVEEGGFSSLEAIARFEVARGHKIERENYLDDIRKREMRKKMASIAVDSETDKGAQCSPGYWITKQSVTDRRTRLPHEASWSSSESEVDAMEKAENNGATRQQVTLRGYVNVERKDLIPDGKGGYFVHIRQHEIRPLPYNHDVYHANLPRMIDRRSNDAVRQFGPNDIGRHQHFNGYNQMRLPAANQYDNLRQGRPIDNRRANYSRPNAKDQTGTHQRRTRFSSPSSSLQPPQATSQPQSSADNWRTAPNHASLTNNIVKKRSRNNR